MEAAILEKKLIYGAFLTCCFSLGFPVFSPLNSFASSTEEDGKYLLFREPYVSRPASVKTEVPSSIKNRAISTIESSAISPQTVNKEEAVDLLADQVEYDESNGVVSAIGHVELVQAGRILRADKITYNLGKDNVQAIGNVVLNEITGDTYFAKTVTLEDKMKDGFVRGLNGVLADGSRFTAEEAEKVADIKIIMRKASYTACEACKEDPFKAPAWQIKARNVTHHKDEARVSYQDATFEVAGVPIAYSPYFSHPDGSIKQKSGFLTPTVGFDTTLGANYAQEYYWNIAPEKDATVGVSVFMEEAPLVTGEYRQRFEDAQIVVSGGATYSGRTDSINGNDVVIDSEERGHLFFDGLWDINEKWRAGSELKVASDDQYLSQYNISNEDILENTAYLERFSNRNYTNARIIKFKDVRTSDRREDQPNVLPEIYTKFMGAPNKTLGGRWDLEASLLGLRREGKDQDVNRASAKAGWQRRHVSDIGLVNTLDLTARGDVYKVSDRDIASAENQRSNSSSALRGFSQAQLKSSYPVAKNFEKAELVIEPIASITTGTNLRDNSDIPNEDSQDVFLDATNLFSANRFPGYDRIEDEAFATYGVRTGLHADNGYQGEVFFGQSYRFDDNDNPFPIGSGLSEQKSDFVGNVSVAAGSALRLNYGMQLENDNLSSQRHELDASSTIGKLSLSTRYFYANALQGTDLDESREQVRLGGRYQFTDKWSILGSAQYDLAEESEGLRYARYGLDYQGQCVNFLVSGQRALTRDSSGDSGTQIMMRLGLKNLGEFETSAFTIGADTDSETSDEQDEINDSLNE